MKTWRADLTTAKCPDPRVSSISYKPAILDVISLSLSLSFLSSSSVSSSGVSSCNGVSPSICVSATTSTVILIKGNIKQEILKTLDYWMHVHSLHIIIKTCLLGLDCLLFQVLVQGTGQEVSFVFVSKFYFFFFAVLLSRLFCNATDTSGPSSGIDRKLILDSSLKFVPRYGWSVKALEAGAKSVELPGVVHGLFPSGGIELVEHFEFDCNAKLIEYLEEVTTRKENPYVCRENLFCAFKF